MCSHKEKEVGRFSKAKKIGKFYHAVTYLKVLKNKLKITW